MISFFEICGESIVSRRAANAGSNHAHPIFLKNSILNLADALDPPTSDLT